MKTKIIIAILIFTSSTLIAQFNVSGEVGFLSDDNIDNNYLQLIDRITTPSLTLSYNLDDDIQNASFFYTGALSYYSLNIVRSHQLHSFGGEYTRTFGDESETTLEAKLSYDTRVDRAEFTVYDYSMLNGSALAKHFFTETSFGQISYNFRLMNFKELTDFNFTEHILSAKYSQQITDGTTLILNIDLGGKYYTNSNDTTSSATSGRGSGSSSQVLPSVIQAIGSARIGQSIWEGTGLSLMAQYQINLRKQTRYLSSDYGLISDDEIFDDHYGYEGPLLQGMLTQVLPFDAKIRFILSRQDRLYSNLPAYDLLGNQIANQRNDIRTAYTLTLTKSFESLGIDLTVGYDYIINSSNDPFYDYTNNAFTAGISVIF